MFTDYDHVLRYYLIAMKNSQNMGPKFQLNDFNQFSFLMLTYSSLDLLNLAIIVLYVCSNAFLVKTVLKPVGR